MNQRKFIVDLIILLITTAIVFYIYWFFFTPNYEIHYQKGIDDKYWMPGFIDGPSLYCEMHSEAECEIKVISAEITQYNPDPAQTDDTPLITASGKTISETTAACPEWLEFGTRIRVDGKEYECSDRMHSRFRRGNYFDLANLVSYESAIAFGRQQKVVEIVRAP